MTALSQRDEEHSLPADTDVRVSKTARRRPSDSQQEEHGLHALNEKLVLLQSGTLSDKPILSLSARRRC